MLIHAENQVNIYIYAFPRARNIGLIGKKFLGRTLNTTVLWWGKIVIDIECRCMSPREFYTFVCPSKCDIERIVDSIQIVRCPDVIASTVY